MQKQQHGIIYLRQNFVWLIQTFKVLKRGKTRKSLRTTDLENKKYHKTFIRKIDVIQYRQYKNM